VLVETRELLTEWVRFTQREREREREGERERSHPPTHIPIPPHKHTRAGTSECNKTPWCVGWLWNACLWNRTHAWFVEQDTRLFVEQDTRLFEEGLFVKQDTRLCPRKTNLGFRVFV
jgi:hypothetical protein